MSSSKITIDLNYFETLLRRAQFHTASSDFTTPAGLPTVTVLKVDHDNLVLRSQAYANLRNNLIKGGTTPENLDILTRNFEEPVEFERAATDTSDGTFLSQMPPPSLRLRQSSQNAHGTFENQPHHVAIRPAAQASWVVPRSRNGYASQNQGRGNQGYGNQSYGNNFSDSSTPNRTENVPGNRNRRRFQSRFTRSVKISNLPVDVTYSEVIAIVRGGLLLDILLHQRDRTATISYMNEGVAAAFLSYIEDNTVNIRGQRVTAHWASRHSLVSSDVAYRVHGGATRNLIILGGSDRHTEASVRKDLEHIDNLVVIKVVISGSDIHLFTNSISIAIVARTCMLSRSKYKPNRIVFDHDECSGLLPRRPILVPVGGQPLLGVGNRSVNKATPIPKNRFEVLRLDDNDNGEGSGSRTG